MAAPDSNKSRPVGVLKEMLEKPDGNFKSSAAEPAMVRVQATFCRERRFCSSLEPSVELIRQVRNGSAGRR